MRVYKRLLKLLLAVDVSFVLVCASVQFYTEHWGEPVQDAAAYMDTERTVIPVGETVGIYINTNGILVIDTGEVTDQNGGVHTPAKNRLISGDYITSLNDVKMKTKKQLIAAITDCGGKSLVFGVNRDGEQIDVLVEPVETSQDVYKVGIWVRDDLQGLGTITYVDGDEFGALGHCITDVDTGTLMKVSGGEIYEADIFGVEKGIAGTPGEIEGMISYDTENVVGHIARNRVYGIFGTITDTLRTSLSGCSPVALAAEDEVKEGTAYIQSCVSGKTEQYEITVEGLDRNDNGDLELEIQVTDQRLLDLTGGIVQGMSGSPILQDGRLIGAVTHVFVNDPTRGYGIYIGSMIEE